MPNNRRGFGGEGYVVREIDGEYFESVFSTNWPTSPDGWPVGTLWRDGPDMKTVYLEEEIPLNGDFEDAPEDLGINWYVPTSVTATIVNDTAEDESEQALQCAFTALGEGVGQEVELEEGHRYLVSGQIKAVVGVALIRVYENGGGYAQVGSAASSATDYNYVEFEFIAAATDYVLQLYGTGITDVHLFDDISLREII